MSFNPQAEAALRVKVMLDRWGEDDESMMLQEEMSNLSDDICTQHKLDNPKAPELTYDEVAARVKSQIDLFTLSDLEKDIPRKWHRDRKPLKHLPATLSQPRTDFWQTPEAKAHGLKLKDVFWLEAEWPKLHAACRRIRALVRTDHKFDNQYSCQLAWEAVPFLLRMHPRDCIGRILDDQFNQHLEAGEVDLNLNTLFLWHDAQTMRRAADRMRNFLHLTAACEELINLLDYK